MGKMGQDLFNLFFIDDDKLLVSIKLQNPAGVRSYHSVSWRIQEQSPHLFYASSIVQNTLVGYAHIANKYPCCTTMPETGLQGQPK